ncbi:hypothetical protein EWM64_g7371 [Hericium alpestre]|uniref:Uncharacterized protein n=1 Tax=Hericium alpestre TaxID=135208 RepID=A0A4Y9ZS65_9AGAM|nr:hypothetical protein EWM64_g7371 [Hericium alpestre]
MAPNLDDINQTAVYIPYEGPDAADGENAQKNGIDDYAPFGERDIPGGCEMRMEAYRATWKECLDRVQSIVKRLHAPVADEIVHQIEDAYENVLSGLPYAELPVFAVSAPSYGSAFVNELATQMESGDEDSEDQDADHPSAYVVHLRPPDCPNIMSAMKALVTGFVERSPDGQEVKRKPTTSLASYDIELLKTWYEVVRDNCDDAESLPALIVFMHDFEQFDDAVVQDLFYICSAHIPRLPLIYILSLSSPPSPSYIHSTYPRSTLSLLRMQTFTLPAGIEVLEEILTETFFSIDFEPQIMVGPATIEFMTEFFSRYTSSLDSVLTILQLAHLKHFDEPLAIFASRDASASLDTAFLSQPACFGFLNSLLTASVDAHAARSASGWKIRDIPALLAFEERAHAEFQSRLRLLRLSFRMLRCVQRVLLSFGYRNAEMEKTVPELMSAALRGQLEREGKYLGTMVKKLAPDKLGVLLSELLKLIRDLPAERQQPFEPAAKHLTDALRSLGSRQGADASALAATEGEWLISWFYNHFVSLEDLQLWEVWYTGSMPFPSELINPSPRATMLSGLLYPHEYVQGSTRPQGTSDDTPSRRRALWELPDTAILFRRYLEAGRMINLYDWYESFGVALESQRRRIERREKKEREKAGAEQNGGDVDGEDKREEAWKLHVQARFMRALHELDFLGFIKHTGRKADHVMRTTFDVPE